MAKTNTLEGSAAGFRAYLFGVTAHVRIGSKMRKPRNEHMSAGFPPIADIARRGCHGRKVP
jgi:hypothetical protein